MLFLSFDQSWGSAQRMYDGVFKDRDAWVVNLGLFGFQDYGIADRIGQYEQKLHILSRNWNSVFGRKRNIFVWEEHSQGLANAWDHLCFTSKQRQFKHVTASRNSLLNPKYRAERFSNHFYAPGDMQDATPSCAAVQCSYSLKATGVCLRVLFQAGIDVGVPNSCLLSW